MNPETLVTDNQQDKTQLTKHNFSAGPCILPQSVMQKAAEAVVELNDSGLSLIEISHRSKAFVEIMDRARSLVREILDVPENYEILFLQGGASLAFYTAALNFMKVGGKAGYINTGTWSKKAIKEARLVGEVIEVGSSEGANFNFIPKDLDLHSGFDYLHITSNNTIFGTQFKSFPNTSDPIVCDMSSDIFSRRIDVSQFAMIYAGAQKNMGPAGTTLYIVNKDLLGQSGRTIPSMLDLQVHIDKASMFNTPPVFAVYTSMLTLQWLKDLGGIDVIEKMNIEKAGILYAEIDRNSLFEGVAAKEDRSLMNVTFLLKDQSLSEDWNAIWESAGINGIKGHRSVGGYRASIYNAMPKSSIELLVGLMKEFETKHT